MITAEVHALPSGQYGSYVADAKPSKNGPVIGLAQLIDGAWHGTPARYDAASLLGQDSWGDGNPIAFLTIDAGARWSLTGEDTAAHVAFAADAWEGAGK